MGIFSRLFGSTDAVKQFKPVPDPTSEMLDEDVFWDLVQTSIEQSDGDQERQIAVLTNDLEKLEPLEIVGFRLRTDRLLYDTYNSKFWCAGYIMNGGCSDDMFEYFRLWLFRRAKPFTDRQKRIRIHSLLSMKRVKSFMSSRCFGMSH